MVTAFKKHGPIKTILQLAVFQGFPGNNKKEVVYNVAEPTKPSDPLVWVKCKEGNEFICSMSSLKNPKKASKEELAKYVDSGSAAYDPGN